MPKKDDAETLTIEGREVRVSNPDKPYFCFAPCVLGEFEITRDQPLTSRYRIITHDGPAKPERYDRLVRDWEFPIKMQAEAVRP